MTWVAKLGPAKIRANATRRLAALRGALSAPLRGRETDLEEEITAQQLTVSLAELDDSERDALAVALSRLWDAFLRRFRSVDGFRGANPSVRVAYIRELSEAASRLEPARATSSGHFFYAVELMRRYAGLLLQDRSEAEVILGALTGKLLERGRELTRAQSASRCGGTHQPGGGARAHV